MTKNKLSFGDGFSPRRQFKIGIINRHQSKKAVGEDFYHVLSKQYFGNDL